MARPLVHVLFPLLLAPSVLAGCDDAPSLDRSRFLRFESRRAVCAERNPERNLYFGDLHVHTNLSFDAANTDVRTGPSDAYRFARGEAIGLPPYDGNGTPQRTVQLTRPLDFAAVTDHAEFFAETSICLDPTAQGYDSYSCTRYRSDMQAQNGSTGDFFLSLIGNPPERPAFCTYDFAGYCLDRVKAIWEDVAVTAETADDRSAGCSFSTFIAYEWSGALQANNWHRNVIFGTSTVPITPTSFIEAWSPERLWTALHEQCLDAGVGCDVLTIPHNGNISAGLMFPVLDEAGAPWSPELAAKRRALEPLIEIYQHKGASECTPSTDPLGSTDEECRFELVVPNVCVGANDPPGCKPMCTPGQGGGFLGNCVSPADFARGALRRGLVEWLRMGENPFAFGFIGSTDTHNALAGGADEEGFEGHVGLQDSNPADRMAAPQGAIVVSRFSSPGGLAAVWSEENSRPALFSALRRRETYGTSGTRITLRVFAGASFDANVCGSASLVSTGYANGVPMGSELTNLSAAPTLLIQAMQDPESAPLQKIEVVKGWYDGDATHEQVFFAAGEENSTASVDPSTCTRSGAGASMLCTTWTDPAWDPAQPAFYYVRVLENPSCRWHRHVCNALSVDCGAISPTDPYAVCCDTDPLLPNAITERAWSSPIWYYPTTP